MEFPSAPGIVRQLQRKLQKKPNNNLIFDEDLNHYVLPVQVKNKVNNLLICCYPQQSFNEIQALKLRLFQNPPFAWIMLSGILDSGFRSSMTEPQIDLFYKKMFELCLRISAYPSTQEPDSESVLYHDVARHLCQWIQISEDPSVLTSAVRPLFSAVTTSLFKKKVGSNLLFLYFAVPQLKIIQTGREGNESLSEFDIFLRNHNYLIMYITLAIREFGHSLGWRGSTRLRAIQSLGLLVPFMAYDMASSDLDAAVFPPLTAESIAFYNNCIVSILLAITWFADFSMLFGLPFCVLSSYMILTLCKKQVLSNTVDLLLDDQLHHLLDDQLYQMNQVQPWMFSNIFHAVVPTQYPYISKKILINLVLLHSYYFPSRTIANDIFSSVMAPIISLTQQGRRSSGVSRGDQIYLNVFMDYANLTKSYPFLNASLARELGNNGATFHAVSQKMHNLMYADSWHSVLQEPPQVFHFSSESHLAVIERSQKWDTRITTALRDFLTSVYDNSRAPLHQLASTAVLYLVSPANASVQAKLSLFMQHLEEYPFLLQSFMKEPSQWLVYYPDCVEEPNDSSSQYYQEQDSAAVQNIPQILFANLCLEPTHTHHWLEMASRQLPFLHDSRDIQELASLFMYLHVLQPAKMQPWLYVWKEKQVQMWKDLANPIESFCSLTDSSEQIPAHYETLLQNIRARDIFETILTQHAYLLIENVKHHNNTPLSQTQDPFLSTLALDTELFLLHQTLKLLPDFLNPLVNDYAVFFDMQNIENLEVSKGGSLMAQSALTLLTSTSRRVDPHFHTDVFDKLIDTTKKYLSTFVPWFHQAKFYKDHIFYVIMRAGEIENEKKRHTLKSLYSTNKTFFLSLFIHFVLQDMSPSTYERPLRQLCLFFKEVPSHEKDIQNVKNFLKAYFFSMPTEDQWTFKQRYPLQIINSFFPFF